MLALAAILKRGARTRGLPCVIVPGDGIGVSSRTLDAGCFNIQLSGLPFHPPGKLIEGCAGWNSNNLRACTSVGLSTGVCNDCWVAIYHNGKVDIGIGFFWYVSFKLHFGFSNKNCFGIHLVIEYTLFHGECTGQWRGR